MNDAKRGQAERALERREVRLRAVAALPARLERVTQAALPEGSLTVLIGEPGTGESEPRGGRGPPDRRANRAPH